MFRQNGQTEEKPKVIEKSISVKSASDQTIIEMSLEYCSRIYIYRRIEKAKEKKQRVSMSVSCKKDGGRG